MELVFQEQDLLLMEQQLADGMSQELTAELTASEQEPDVNRVVDSFGTLILRERLLSPGSISLSGGVRAGVLYVPEGETEPRLMEAYLPFNFHREAEAITADSKAIWQCRIKEVDARMLNSRKVLLRVGVSCDVTVYGPKHQPLYDLPQPPEGLCLQRVTVPMVLPLDVGEKAFVINDEVNLPDNAEPIDRVLKTLFRLEQGDSKVVGSKVLFKGTVHLHTLYRSMDGNLCVFDGELPFSQYVELSRDLDEQEAQVRLFLSGAEVEPDGQMECRRLLAALNLVAQTLVSGRQEVSYIEDAYDLTQNLEPQWKTMGLTGRLDSQQLRDTLSGTMLVPANRVLDVWAYPQDVLRQRNGDRVDLQYGVACNVVYYDETGILQGKIVHINQNQAIALAPNAECRPSCRLESAVTCQPGSEPLLRCRMNLQVDSYARQEFRCLSGGKLVPARVEGERPSLILRRVQPEESLWSIAKANRTTVERLMDANALTTENPPEGRMLLIPM